MYVCMQMPNQVNMVTFVTQNQRKMKVNILNLLLRSQQFKKDAQTFIAYLTETFVNVLTFIKLSHHNQFRGDHIL